MPFSKYYKAVLEIFWESAVQIDTLLTYLLTKAVFGGLTDISYTFYSAYVWNIMNLGWH